MYSEIIDKNIAAALKENRTVDLSVWRSVKAEFLNYKTAKAGNVLTDAVEFTIIGKMLTQHKDSIEQFKQAGRFDLVEKETKEAEVLASLLPKEPTEEDILNAVSEVVEVIKMNGDVSMKNMKEVQEAVKKKYPTANGGMIAQIFRKFI